MTYTEADYRRSHRFFVTTTIIVVVGWGLVMAIWALMAISRARSASKSDQRTVQQLRDDVRFYKECFHKEREEYQRLSQMSSDYSRELSDRLQFRRRILAVSTNAIGCPLDTFIVIRTDEGIGAIMFTERTLSSSGGPRSPDSLPNARAKYKWFYRAGLSGRFTDPDTQSGEGEVFEEYAPSDVRDSDDLFVTRPGAMDTRGEGASIDEDASRMGKRIMYVDAGNGLVHCGPIALEWSSPLYLYFLGSLFSTDDGPFVELAVTNTGEIAEVDANDPTLIWCSRKPQPDAEFQYDSRWPGLVHCGLLVLRILATY